LKEIGRSPSYRSLDSKEKKQKGKKFDPSVMNIRGNFGDGRRGSLMSM
jgi:hypothetical protein